MKPIIKTVNLKIHTGNNRRRVNYNDRKNFDLLVVNLQDGVKSRTFEIESKYLPEADSIHLEFNPLTREVGWSPKAIIPYVKEIK